MPPTALGVPRDRGLPGLQGGRCVTERQRHTVRVYRDRDGRTLRAGDKVRVVGVPDLSRMNAVVRGETQRVFAHLVGQDKRITEFGWGEARLDFRILRGRDRGYHAVWIQTSLLKYRGTPANNKMQQTRRG